MQPKTKAEAPSAAPGIEGGTVSVVQPDGTVKEVSTKDLYVSVTDDQKPLPISSGLQEKLDHAEVTLDEVLEVSDQIFTTNEDGEIVLKPVIVEDAVTVDPNTLLKQDVLDRMKARIMLNDRANAYLELYKSTGEEQLLLQAQITTYSGAMGSGAIVGNMLAKDMAGDLYNVSLDQFSLDILQGTYDAAATMVGKSVALMNRNFFQDADWGVWASKGMGHLFPGNIQFVDYEFHKNSELAKAIYNSQGTKNALQLGQEFMTPYSDVKGLGQRPADYESVEGYHTIEGKRFISVIDESTGAIEVFWDKDLSVVASEWPSRLPPYDELKPKQIDNTPRVMNDWNFNAGNAVREYVQAGFNHIPAYDPAKSFKNFGVQNEYLIHIRNNISENDFSVWTQKKGK